MEYIDIVKIVKDEREEHEYIYEVFRYNDINYSIFFTNYKYLFNMNSNYLKIRITLILIYRMMDNRRIYE